MSNVIRAVSSRPSAAFVGDAAGAVSIVVMLMGGLCLPGLF